MLAILAEAADRDGALGCLLAADHQQRRHLGERVLAHLVIDRLVAQVARDPQAGALCRRDHLVGIGVGVFGDGGYHGLHRREP